MQPACVRFLGPSRLSCCVGMPDHPGEWCRNWDRDPPLGKHPSCEKWTWLTLPIGSDEVVSLPFSILELKLQPAVGELSLH